MARYLARPFPAKKLELLERRERQILREIDTGIESELLFLAAEKVREAQLAYLKAKRYYVVDDGSRDFPGFKKIDLALADWQSKTPEEVVKHYKKLQRSTIRSS
jgi:hypothetical protein